MKLSPVQKAILALIVANIIWGAAAPIFKLSLVNIPPFTLAFWRFFLGAAILLMLFGKRMVIVGNLFQKDALALVAFTFTGITFNIICYFLGLKITLAINAPIISASAPILTMILALIFLREKFSFRKLFGMIIGLVGIFTIVIDPLLTTGLDGSIVGNIFIILATLGAVGQTIIGKKLLPKYDPIMITFWTFLIGAITFLPLATYELGNQPLLYGLLDWRGYLGIFYGAVFSSAAAYSLFGWGLAKMQATDASIFAYIDPIFGTIFSFYLLNEPITLPFVVGSMLIFGGVLVSEGRISHYPIRKLLHRQD